MIYTRQCSKAARRIPNPTVLGSIPRACAFLAVSWVFMAGTYTHKDGQRVSQYAEPPKVYIQPGTVETRRYSDEHTYLHGAGSWDYEHLYNRSRSP